MANSYNHRQEQDHLKLLLIRTGKTKGGCIVQCPPVHLCVMIRRVYAETPAVLFTKSPFT